MGEGEKRNLNTDINNLLNRFEYVTSPEDFYYTLQEYFKELFNISFCEIIKLVPYPPFYKTLIKSKLDPAITNHLSLENQINFENRFVLNRGSFIFLLDFKYILYLNHVSESDAFHMDILCGHINRLFKIMLNNYKKGYEQSSLENANLISQISHDINSMISLVKTHTPKLKKAVCQKIEYTEKMTKDILQYVREVQLLTSEVEVDELLNSIIQNIAIPKNIKVSTEFKTANKKINLDVELIDRAVGEIINNAINAVGKNGKINISAHIFNYKNLLQNQDFLVVEVEDNGEGINNDFLGFIKNPYFTTRKADYHSGLGLALADKIIEAHGGYINIESTQYNLTLVKIYLPLNGYNNE